jgi:putrescine transport system substrate-binding protein
MVPEVAGKVTSARNEYGLQDGSGQKKNSAQYCCALFRWQDGKMIPWMRWAVLVGMLIVPLWGCSEKSVAPVVHVYNWSDYIAPSVLEAFTAETGIRVVYDVYDSNEVLETKITTGRSGYDVIFPTANPYAERHIQQGLYLPLDFAQLPNLQHLDPLLMERLTTVDPGNRHTVPYMWGTTGIGYDARKVAEILGDAAPADRWALLFDPVLAAQFAECGIAVLDDALEVLTATMLYLGHDPNSTDPALLQEAVDQLMEVRPYIRYFHSSRYINDLANGELCLVLGYSGDILQARDRAEESGTERKIEYRIPQEGALLWFDVMAIPVDAPHPEAAHRFINFLMEPHHMAASTNAVAYANANLPAAAYVDAHILADPGIYPHEEVRARLVTLAALSPENNRARVRAWSQVKTGR